LAGGQVRGAVRPAIGSQPSKTSLVEIAIIAAPFVTQACAISPAAVPLRRMASWGSRAQPSTSVQAAAWMTMPAVCG